MKSTCPECGWSDNGTPTSEWRDGCPNCEWNAPTFTDAQMAEVYARFDARPLSAILTDAPPLARRLAVLRGPVTRRRSR